MKNSAEMSRNCSEGIAKIDMESGALKGAPGYVGKRFEKGEENGQFLTGL